MRLKLANLVDVNHCFPVRYRVILSKRSYFRYWPTLVSNLELGAPRRAALDPSRCWNELLRFAA